MITLEKPARYPRIDIGYHRAVHHQAAHQAVDDHHTEPAFAHHADGAGKHHQGPEYRENGAGNGYHHCRISGKAEARHYRIGEQRVGGKHRRQHQRRESVEMQKRMCTYHAENQRYKEGKQAKHKSPPDVFLEVIHVDLHTRQKHQVKDAHLAEYLETHVTCKDIEAVRPYEHARHNQAYDMRNLEPRQQQRHKQDDSQYDKKYRDRLCDERCGCEYGGRQGHRQASSMDYLRWSRIYCAICTALSAAPFLIWSPTTQNVRPQGEARSLRRRPT